MDSGRTTSRVPAECMSCNWTLWMGLTKVTWAKVANLWLCVPRSNLLCTETGCVNGLGHCHCDKEMYVTTRLYRDIWLLSRARPLPLLFKWTHPAKLLQCLLRMKKVSGQIYPDAKSEQVKKGGIAFSKSWHKIVHILLLPTNLQSENHPID